MSGWKVFGTVLILCILVLFTIVYGIGMRKEGE